MYKLVAQLIKYKILKSPKNSNHDNIAVNIEIIRTCKPVVDVFEVYNFPLKIKMNLNAYRQYPTNIHEMNDLDNICNERIDLYTILQKAKSHNLKIGSYEWFQFIIIEINGSELPTYRTLINSKGPIPLKVARRNDNIAHWLLSTCYCKTHQTQQYFIEWELEWIHCLFMKLEKHDIRKFLKENNFNYRICGILEKLDYLRSLYNCTPSVKYIDDVIDTTFYKIEFSHSGYKLLSNMEVFIRNSKAYVNEENIIYAIKDALRIQFLEQLQFQKKVLPNLQDDKFKFFLNTIPIFSPTFGAYSITGVRYDNIDEIAEQHFPLCMKYLHKRLRLNHHLKYDGKMQYGVFLYWLGLSLNDAIRLWRDEFTKKIDEKMYKQKYEYLFKHQYGEVGRKRPYEAYTCSKILDAHPLADKYYGCPFKHHTDQISKDLKLELEPSDLKDIEDLMNEGHYQKACTKHFCITRNVSEESVKVIESPNYYVKQSIQVDFK